MYREKAIDKSDMDTGCREIELIEMKKKGISGDVIKALSDSYIAHWKEDRKQYGFSREEENLHVK